VNLTTLTPAESECLQIKIYSLGGRNKRSFQSCGHWRGNCLPFQHPALSTRDHSVLQAVQCQRGALHCRLKTSMTSCLYIRKEFNDYFVTVEVIAQLYAIIAIYDVLIAF